MALIISSLIICVSTLLQLAGGMLSDRTEIIFYDFTNALNAFVPYVFCYFLTQYRTSIKRLYKAFWAVLCLLLFSTAYGDRISFAVGIFVSLFCTFFFEKFNSYISLTVTAVSAVVFGLLFRISADFFSNILMTVSFAISNKGLVSSVLFGILNTLLSVFDINSFEELFFHKSYGGTIINSGEVITGIKDMVENGYSGNVISTYLSGHYFLISALTGMSISLADELKSAQKICLIIVSFATVLSGNISLMLAFVFLESWHLFASILLISGLSYISAYLLKINAYYLLDGGIIELIRYIDKPVYLIVGCLVFLAIGYFICKYSVLKFGISDSLNIYIPDRLNRLVKSLGGVVNIVKISDDTVEVRNPKLVNNFEIDCEIRENLVKVNDEKIEELKEYI